MMERDAVRRIIGILEGDGAIKERLFAAASLFWSATFEVGSWPTPCQARLEELLARLLENGPIRQTVNQMSETTAQETAMLLLRFVRESETLFP